MKPLIIYGDINDDKITFTKEKLEEIIDQVYQTGFTDGQTKTNYPYYTSDSPHIKMPYEVTCNGLYTSKDTEDVGRPMVK